MNTAEQHTLNADALARRFLRTETAPAFGAGSVAAEQDRTFSMLSHLFALPMWLWKRKESPAVDAHGKEALNFGITVAICLIPLSFVMSFVLGLLGIKVLFLLYSLLMAVIGLAMLGLVVFGMLKARDGQLVRYPLNFRLIK